MTYEEAEQLVQGAVGRVVVLLVRRVGVTCQQRQFIVGPGSQREDPRLDEGRDRLGPVGLRRADPHVLVVERDHGPDAEDSDGGGRPGEGEVPGPVEPADEPTLDQEQEHQQRAQRQPGHPGQPGGHGVVLIVGQAGDLRPVHLGRRRQDPSPHQVVRLGEVCGRQGIERLLLVEVRLLDDPGIHGKVRRQGADAGDDGWVRTRHLRCRGDVRRRGRQIALVAVLEGDRLESPLEERCGGRRVRVGQRGVDGLRGHHERLGGLPRGGRRRLSLRHRQSREQPTDESEEDERTPGQPQRARGRTACDSRAASVPRRRHVRRCRDRHLNPSLATAETHPCVEA